MIRPGVILALWLLGLVFAVANGAFGNIILQPMVGAYANHVIKTVAAILWMLFISLLHALSTRGPAFTKAAWIAGITWLILTVAFEFLAGHYLFGNNWDVLIADYQIWNGRLWTLVLAALLFGPALMAWLVGRNQARKQPGS